MALASHPGTRTDLLISHPNEYRGDNYKSPPPPLKGGGN